MKVSGLPGYVQICLLLSLLIIGIFSACAPEKNDKENNENRNEWIGKISVQNDTLYVLDYIVSERNTTVVYVKKIRNCDYVFWQNSYGSDIEHAGDCTNPKCLYKE